MENVFSHLQSPADLRRLNGTLRIREAIVARWLRRIAIGCLTVDFPSGNRRVFGSPKSDFEATIKINDMRVVLRVLSAGDLGLAEGYVAGEWDTPDLTALLLLGVLNTEALSGVIAANRLTTFFNRVRHARRANTRRGSRRNIAAHYDLGNEFYRLWLDESMTYSSALFEHPDEDLLDAQHRKYARLATKLGIRADDRVLEIGCGWGGFAEYAAAELGCDVVGLTLSREQAAYARARMVRSGMADRVEIRIEDYRDVEEKFDHIVSIEMFEAVGQENWATYFATLDRCLKPGGKVALQSITIADEHFDGYRRNPDFIQRYIFPGGMLPSPEVFRQAVEEGGFRIADGYFSGKYYAETLRRWRRAFEDNWSAIELLGFDEHFRRLWLFYLCYCEAGFEHGRVDVGQFLIERR